MVRKLRKVITWQMFSTLAQVVGSGMMTPLLRQLLKELYWNLDPRVSRIFFTIGEQTLLASMHRHLGNIVCFQSSFVFLCLSYKYVLSCIAEICQSLVIPQTRYKICYLLLSYLFNFKFNSNNNTILAHAVWSNDKFYTK